MTNRAGFAVLALAGGNIGYALLLWLLMVVVARRLGSTAVGELTLALSVTGPAFILGALQLRLLLITDAGPGDRWRHYARIRGWSGLAAVAASVAVAALLVRRPAVVLVCALVAMCRYVDLWADLAAAVDQAAGRLVRTVVSQTARGALALAAVALATSRGLSLPAGLVLWLAAWCGFVFTFDRRALRAASRPAVGEAATSQGGAVLWATVQAGGALAIAAFLNSVTANLPRIWLGRQGSLEALGEFGVVTYVVAAASAVFGAGALGVAPFFSLRFGRGDRRRSVLRAALVGAAVAAAVALILSWQAARLVHVLLGSAFQRSVEVLRIVVWALPFYAVATAGNTAAVAERRGRQQIVAYAVTIAATCLVLIFGPGDRPAAVAARAVVFGGAVQAVAVMAGLRLGRSGA